VKKATFALRGRNPDVLTCIANLSNDAVFTPPDFANRMLDTLSDAWSAANDGASIWADPDVTFLDPFTKSGVFLREIVKRLIEGLGAAIPDLARRVDHILTKQVYGIGTERLTALLARRSVYCSKYANGPHSVAKSFDTESGNIWFERTEHTWVGGTERILDTNSGGNTTKRATNGRCKYCGASQKEYERDESLESHAYAFIHTDNIKARIAELFGDDMHFDVIIGNPPYQLNDGGGAGNSASPIYQKFVEQAQALDPSILTMVVPAKWYSGGKGLDKFRDRMLRDKRIRYLADYPDSRDAFTGVDVAGGVCYFLWNRDDEGSCVVETFTNGRRFTAVRELDEFETLVRDNRALSIVHKVRAKAPRMMSEVVSSRKPFGLESAEEGDPTGDLYLYASGGDSRIATQDVPKGHDLIDAWKVLLSKTSSEHAGQTDRGGRKRVLSRIEVMPPKSVATESYLIVGKFQNEEEAENAAAYLKTKFLRFLVSTILLTQNISKGMFEFAPAVDFSQRWTDELLCTEFGLDADEIKLIDETIRPMEGIGPPDEAEEFKK